MRRTHLLTVQTALLGMALAAQSGCVTADEDNPLLILQNQAPGPDCTLDASSNLFNSRGAIDTLSNQGYLLTPVVQNTSVTSTTASRVQRLITLEGASVSIGFEPGLFSDGEIDSLGNLADFSQAFSAIVEPDNGRAVVAIDIMPEALLETIGGKLAPGDATFVTATVQLFGKHGTRELVSQPFAYPIDVCNGCLLVNQGDCAALPEDFMARAGGACRLLQDGVLDCCTEDGAQVCPARSSAMAAR